MAAPTVRPNVLVILADQFRGMDTGHAGNDQVHTPNLDRLAGQGAAFTRAYANAPACGPSRASLLTGRLPTGHRVVANDLPLPEDMPTLSGTLAGAGYRTGYIGKWHLDGMPRDKWVPPGPRRHGFGYWAATNCAHDYFDAHYYTDHPEPVRFSGYEPEVQTGLAVDFITRQAGEPYLLFVSYGPPHDPYDQVPERNARRYDAGRLRLRPNVPTADTAAALRTAHYYAAITAVDEQVGRLLAAVDAAGQHDRTVVVFTSDHGDMLGSHGYRAKQQPREESIAVPLLVRWPGVIRPRLVGAGLVGTADLAPTLLGLVGAGSLPGAHGRDLSGPLTAARHAVWPRSVPLANVVSFDDGYRQGIPEWRGVRTLRHTYARTEDGKPWLLYDNLTDPYQFHNLAAEGTADAGLLAELDAEADRWLAAAGDPFLGGMEHLRRLGLVEAWNRRERELHGHTARLLDP